MMTVEIGPDVFDIARYSTHVTLRPLERVEPVTVRHGETTRTVHTSNIAQIFREVTFAPANLCDRPFTIRYATRQGGYIKPSWRGAENGASAADLGRYNDYGTEFFFVFRPQLGSDKSYSLDVEVLNGFEEGHRDAHFHLGRDRLYRVLTYKIDLSQYLTASSTLPHEPRLYLHDVDQQHHELQSLRESAEPLQPSRSPAAGVWIWELKEVRGGVVDISWDVGP